MAVWHGGFLKKCHQIAVALWVSNGGAIGLTVVVAEWRKKLFFFENFPKMRLGRLGLTRPNPKPGFRIKMGWAAHNTRTPELQREQHAPATTAPRTSVRSHPKLTTAPCTTHASNDGDGVGNDYRLQRHLVLFFFCSVFLYFLSLKYLFNFLITFFLKYVMCVFLHFLTISTTSFTKHLWFNKLT